MSRLTRTWKPVGLGFGLLAGLALSASSSEAHDPPPLARQLNDLGRQAVNQNQPAAARGFFERVLELDRANPEALRALEALAETERAAQNPGAGKPGQAQAGGAATIERQHQLETIARQQLAADIAERLQRARDLQDAGQPEAALDVLRLAQTVVRAADQVSEDDRNALARQIQAQVLATARAEEQIVARRAEAARLDAAAEQQARAAHLAARNDDTASALMTQFAALMAQGQYNVLANGGAGNIAATTAPFVDARVLAQKVQALVPHAPAPRAGIMVAATTGFLAQEHAFEQLKEYRTMSSLQDVARASVPFPDTDVVEFPAADEWKSRSERRIARYGAAMDLQGRDPKTKAILEKLEQPVTMSFPQDTTLEDVLRYVRSATQGPNDSGIAIYVDPKGLQEADQTLNSVVQLDLEGVPLKTTLRLLLKQIGLTYTVKDGILTITSIDAADQPSELRVYPVADLAIIPYSLLSGGGGGTGGMGMGGAGGMGMGMGNGMGMGAGNMF